MFIKLNIL